MTTQQTYQATIKFAALKHAEAGQTIPGTKIPYVVHLSNVAMEILFASTHTTEFDLNFALQAALLHDTLEDTDTTREELAEIFGIEVADAVAALTKDAQLPKAERMTDSLSRVKKLRKEAWAVKLADRITNLQAPPPHWSDSKKREYRQEAQLIMESLKGGNPYLEERLAAQIAAYGSFIGGER